MKDPGPRFGIHGLFLKITRVPTEPENFIEIRPSLFELSCTHTQTERERERERERDTSDGFLAC